MCIIMSCCSSYLSLLVFHSLLMKTSDGFVKKHCILSEWSEWSPCSANCSVGRNTRSRYIKQDAAGMFSKPCDNDRFNSRVCGSENNGCEMLCEPNTGNCFCKSGFELGGDKKKCFNVNECEHNDGLGYCSHKCVDTPGSYTCLCNNGFYLAPDRHDCIFNTTVICSDALHLQSGEQCICKNGLEGTRCDLNPSLCSNLNKSSCHSTELCSRSIHASKNCLEADFQIPVLLKMKHKTYNGGNTVSQVEQYIEDILVGTVTGKSLDNLRGYNYISRLRNNPTKDRTYYVESLSNVKVKSSYTYVKFGVLDVKDNFRSLTMSEVCLLLKSTDVQCVTEKDCSIMKEDGLQCPTITSYTSALFRAQKSNSNHKLKSWVYILISGFAIIVVLLIILVFMYLRRGKHAQNTSAMYNNNISQPIIFRSEYDPLTQRDAVANWNNDPRNCSDILSSDTSFEAGNYELYGDETDTLHDKADPIYQSIGSLKKHVDDNDSCSSSPAIDNVCEPRYIEPRKLEICTGGNLGKNLETYVSPKGEICTQVVDISIAENCGHYASPPSHCLEGKDSNSKMRVDLAGLEEPRYSLPPGKK